MQLLVKAITWMESKDKQNNLKHAIKTNHIENDVIFKC